MLEAFRLLCALPGAPTVYYGDELGMEGMADPWNRAPMVWDKGDKAMRRALKKILQARQAKPMLQTGFLVRGRAGYGYTDRPPLRGQGPGRVRQAAGRPGRHGEDQPVNLSPLESEAHFSCTLPPFA